MARKKRLLSKLLIYAMLEAGAIMGVPMRPDQIEEMTRLMNDAVIEEVVREDSGDPPA